MVDVVLSIDTNTVIVTKNDADDLDTTPDVMAVGDIVTVVFYNVRVRALDALTDLLLNRSSEA